MSKVEDTTSVGEQRRVLLEGMAGFDHVIERQEQRGQASLVASAQLPCEGSVCEEARFAAMGIRLGPIPTEGDVLFRDAVLPDGWKLEPTEHAMWSDLLDDQGRKRAVVFYKAAFYDRSAFVRLQCRFEIRMQFEGPDEDQSAYAVVDAGAGGNLLFVADVPLSPARDASRLERDAYFAQRDVARDKCVRWLEHRYPDYMDPTAYW